MPILIISWYAHLALISNIICPAPYRIVLSAFHTKTFQDAFLPNTPQAARKHPSISPLYFDFSSLAPDAALPPALLICGTEDCVLDDTAFMGVKWQIAGGEAVVKFFPGARHGFMNFPPELPGVTEATECMNCFLQERV
jgi:acetyl esterase/lipase